MSKGVKQGAVLSPIRFTAYFDKLFEGLRASGIGCHVGKMYAGAFGYADDMVLLAPSLDALREMAKHMLQNIIYYLIHQSQNLCILTYLMKI